MAYSMFEQPRVNNSKSIQYYPEEFNNAERIFHNTEQNLSRHEEIKPKGKKSHSLKVEYPSEKKCPIYVHHYTKPHNADRILNNYSTKTLYEPSNVGSIKESKNVRVKNNTRVAKNRHVLKTQKSLMDKLEESYWASWKPNKEIEMGEVIKNSKKIRSDPYSKTSKISCDAEVQHYAAFSSASVLMDSKKSVARKRMSSQEIQTDLCPMILANIDGILSPTTDDVSANTATSISTLEKSTAETMQEIMSTDEPVTSATNELVSINGEEQVNILKHTDSLIINKKKQSEVRDHFQQPRCIRLYKNSPISSINTSLIKGGSYPLKSCIRQDKSQKSSLSILGRPGSHLIMSSSFNRKIKKT